MAEDGHQVKPHHLHVVTVALCKELFECLITMLTQSF